jgi:CRP-like cAMP-binding protein
MNEKASAILELYSSALADIAKFDEHTAGHFRRPEIPKEEKKQKKRIRRGNITGAANDDEDDEAEEPPPPKSEEQHKQISYALHNSSCAYLFSAMDSDAMDSITDAMSQEKIAAGVTLIKQGEKGNKFYVLESGEMEVLVNNEVVGKAKAPGAFGELALMYNSPRAATLRATTDCEVWSLGRKAFRKLLMEKESKKTINIYQFLSYVKIFSSLSKQQISMLVGAVDEEHFAEGDYIIRQGEEGDTFYIIKSGQVVCTKNFRRKKAPKKIEKEAEKVAPVDKGGYRFTVIFGEWGTYEYSFNKEGQAEGEGPTRWKLEGEEEGTVELVLEEGDAVDGVGITAEELVGQHVEVWWIQDGAWYAGEVLSMRWAEASGGVGGARKREDHEEANDEGEKEEEHEQEEQQQEEEQEEQEEEEQQEEEEEEEQQKEEEGWEDVMEELVKVRRCSPTYRHVCCC